MAKKLISKCPFCNGDLLVSRIKCVACETQIDSVPHNPRYTDFQITF